MTTTRSTTYTWLKKYIASLPRDEGVFLTEVDIAREAGTSRTPVREAFMRLASEGLLELIPRRGAWVAPISDSEITTVMEARQMVEEWSVRTLSHHATPELITELENCLDRQKAAVKDPVAFIEVDREFHTALVTATGNDVVARMYAGLLDRQQRMGMYAVSADAERSHHVVEEHRRIVSGIQQGETASAVERMSAHLDQTLAAMLGATANRGAQARRTAMEGEVV